MIASTIDIQESSRSWFGLVDLGWLRFMIKRCDLNTSNLPDGYGVRCSSIYVNLSNFRPTLSKF